MPRYFIGTLIYFWIPIVIMGLALRPRLDKNTMKALGLTFLILFPATFAMEYVYLWTDIWNFSEAMDPLLGIRFWGAPLEEFSFWFGAGPFVLLMYLVFDQLTGKKVGQDA